MSYKTKVTGAIASLKERSGSSLQAIKKALGAAPNQWRFINAALKSGTASGLYTKNGGKYKNVKQAAPKKKKAKKKTVVKKKKWRKGWYLRKVRLSRLRMLLGVQERRNLGILSQF